MPYIFLVAILMIMPEGIGDAYEKWKIDRLRIKKETNTERDVKIATGLALLPTGIFGLHHWWRGRTHRMQTFSVIAIASYVFHRFSNFVERNSFADGSCADSCQESEFAETNLAILTGRNDGELKLEDSPLTETHLLDQTSAPSGMTPFETEQWIPDALADMRQSWLNQMKFEIDLVNFIADAGDLIWPLALLVLWAFSVYEGIRIMNGKENEKISFPLFPKWKSIFDSTTSPISDTRQKLSELDRNHERIVKQLREKLSNYLKTGELKSHAIDFSLRFTEPVMKALKIPETRKTELKLYGRQSPIGSWISFFILVTILVMFLVWLPIAESDNFEFKKVLQVSNVLLTLSIFILMAFSLNLHTGYTGMVNFGIIFFVSIGAITVSILTAPERVFGYKWGILEATIVAMILSAAIGWLLAYPTARLRTDYFAIVTISPVSYTHLTLPTKA